VVSSHDRGKEEKMKGDKKDASLLHVIDCC
jgi:hypothetical protein